MLSLHLYNVFLYVNATPSRIKLKAKEPCAKRGEMFKEYCQGQKSLDILRWSNNMLTNVTMYNSANFHSAIIIILCFGFNFIWHFFLSYLLLFQHCTACNDCIIISSIFMEKIWSGHAVILWEEKVDFLNILAFIHKIRSFIGGHTM